VVLDLVENLDDDVDVRSREERVHAGGCPIGVRGLEEPTRSTMPLAVSSSTIRPTNRTWSTVNRLPSR